MQVVVISKDQQEHVNGMLAALTGHDVVYVLDRCTYSMPWPDNVRVVENRAGTGFLAGRMRDLGASLHDASRPILFLDGDKIPHGDLSILEATPFDAVCLGVYEDHRGWINEGEGTIPWMQIGDFINPHNGVYSCGLFLTPRAIHAIKKYSSEGRIFNEAFDGNWGEEDRFIGDVLAHEEMTIGYTDKIKLSGNITNENEASEKVVHNFLRRLRIRAKFNGKGSQHQ